jgi:hypothetical protein
MRSTAYPPGLIRGPHETIDDLKIVFHHHLKGIEMLQLPKINVQVIKSSGNLIEMDPNRPYLAIALIEHF